MATTRFSKAAKDYHERMLRQGRRKRAEGRRRALERQLTFDCIHGRRMYAIDAEGRRVDLKAEFSDWKVVLTFTKEDAGRMQRDFRKGDRIPKKTVVVRTDIYHAVRLLKHIQGRHKAEIKMAEELFEKINPAHWDLYKERSTISQQKLEAVQKRILGCIEEASKKTGGYKTLAGIRLAEVPKALEEMVAENGASTKEERVRRACNELAAFKLRYGEWRDDQIADIDMYEKVRNDGLRPERDRRLQDLLLELAGKLEGRNSIGVAFTLAVDWEVIKKLRKAKKSITRNKPDEALEAIADCGRVLKAEWLKEDLRKVYKFISGSAKSRPLGWRNEARRMLEEFARYLGQRNTRYIITELNKTKDSGMEEVTAGMETGNARIRQALKDGRFWLKKKLLKEAGMAYRKAAVALAINHAWAGPAGQKGPEKGI